MRYPQKSSSSSSLFIMHPLPDDFIKMSADLDITGPENEKSSRTVETSSYEKLPSGIIIKLIDYQSDEVNYVVIVRLHKVLLKCLIKN